MIRYNVHPAWRFILALKSIGRHPGELGLPAKGGKTIWNAVSQYMADFLMLSLNIEDIDENHVFYDALAAYRLYKTTRVRVYYETYLLAGGPYNDFGIELGMSKNTELLYKEAFFDVDELRTPILKTAYIEMLDDYNEKDIKSQWSKGYEKIIALSGYSKGREVSRSPNEIMKDAMADADNLRTRAITTTVKMQWSDAIARLGAKLINNDADVEKSLKDLTLSLDFNNSEVPTFSPGPENGNPEPKNDDSKNT